jgi:hypothetical protein
MTMYRPVKVACARCGEVSMHEELGSVTNSGSADLDGRPPPRARYTMSAWLQECPNCLYVARNLSEATAEEADVVREIGFIESGLSENMPDLATRFMRRAYIDEQTGQLHEAVRRLLHAAWVLDDFEIDAASVRLRAAQMILALGSQADTELRLKRLDLLRRAMAFRQAISEADDMLKELVEPISRKIAVAQRRAAFERRSTAMSLSEAMHPPARRGHLRVVTFPRPS